MKFQQIKEGLGQDADHMEQDHEVQMARADCFHAAKNAIELHRLLKNISERQGLEGWVSEKITLAADYLRTVKEYMEYEQQKGSSINFEPTDYNNAIDQFLGENVNERKENESGSSDFERRINTPNLSGRARELLIKAFGQFPQAKNEIDAIINYLEQVKNSGENNIDRLGRENRQQDSAIDQLSQENTTEIQQIQKLEQELQKIKQRTMAKTQPSSSMSSGIQETTTAGAVAAVSKPLLKKPIKR
jgi:hypothetical protein